MWRTVDGATQLSKQAKLVCTRLQEVVKESDEPEDLRELILQAVRKERPYVEYVYVVRVIDIGVVRAVLYRFEQIFDSISVNLHRIESTDAVHRPMLNWQWKDDKELEVSALSAIVASKMGKSDDVVSAMCSTCYFSGSEVEEEGSKGDEEEDEEEVEVEEVVPEKKKLRKPRMVVPTPVKKNKRKGGAPKKAVVCQTAATQKGMLNECVYVLTVRRQIEFGTSRKKHS